MKNHIKTKSGGKSLQLDDNAPKSQEYANFLEELRADCLCTCRKVIFPLIKDGIEQDWTDAEKFSLFENMSTDLLNEFDDDLIEFKEKCLNRYYEFLAKKKD